MTSRRRRDGLAENAGRFRSRKKGQVFVIGAVMFGALLLLVSVPAGPSLQDESGTDFRRFFQQSLKNNIDAYNEELAENKSIDNVKRGLYSYNRFVYESSSSKGIDFEAYQLAILPHEGKSVFINYRDSSLQTNLSINGSWTNTTVHDKQFLEKNFTAGSANVTLFLPDLNNSHNFTAHRPRIAYWMKMSAEDESWQNSIIG